MRISDWSSDVCSSDLADRPGEPQSYPGPFRRRGRAQNGAYIGSGLLFSRFGEARRAPPDHGRGGLAQRKGAPRRGGTADELRSEEHTSELQSLMRISYAVFCLKKKIKNTKHVIT